MSTPTNPNGAGGSLYSAWDKVQIPSPAKADDVQLAVKSWMEAHPELAKLALSNKDIEAIKKLTQLTDDFSGLGIMPTDGPLLEPIDRTFPIFESGDKRAVLRLVGWFDFDRRYYEIKAYLGHVVHGAETWWYHGHTMAPTAPTPQLLSSWMPHNIKLEFYDTFKLDLWVKNNVLHAVAQTRFDGDKVEILRKFRVLKLEPSF
ncbi:hypothetical protein ONZ45_g12812 [Pleurotus djamor]|nr:hypothetical protein ONZ45_g12812 [Pleurotus djamor]